MAQESTDLVQELPSNRSDGRSPEPAEPSSLSRSSSGGSRLNASAPEFVPRGPARGDHHHHPPRHHHRHPPQPPRMVPVHHPHPHPHHGPPPPPPMIHMFQPHPGAFHGSPSFEYYGGGGGIPEHEAAHGHGHGHGHAESEAASAAEHAAAGDGLPEEVVHKVTKQVEYYFSDVNLATTEHLMRFISKDSEGFVPISVLAPFKKIRALVSNNSQLAAALRTSTKLVVSEDGKKVRRHQPITEADLDELQSRIVVAENLPEDHCYQNLMKVFSVVGGVKTIRTCYPQNTNGTAPVNARPGKLDALLFNKLHAFVEYETVEQAEKAVLELNDEGNWRNGLRVRLLASCMRQGQVRGKKLGNEGEANAEDEESSQPNPLNEKHSEDQLHEASNGQMGEEGHHEKDGISKRGRGRGRGGRGRGRGQYHNNNRNDGHSVGTPPSHHHVQMEQAAAANKQPPGPRMPDGTRGFTMGRGKPLSTSAPVS